MTRAPAFFRVCPTDSSPFVLSRGAVHGKKVRITPDELKIRASLAIRPIATRRNADRIGNSRGAPIGRHHLRLAV